MCGRICVMFGTNQLLWQQICKKNFFLNEQEIAHKQFAWPSSCQCQKYWSSKRWPTYLPKNEARPECHHRIGPSYPHLLCFHARFRPTSSNVDDPAHGPSPEHMGWHAGGMPVAAEHGDTESQQRWRKTQALHKVLLAAQVAKAANDQWRGLLLDLIEIAANDYWRTAGNGYRNFSILFVVGAGCGCWLLLWLSCLKGKVWHF